MDSPHAMLFAVLAVTLGACAAASRPEAGVAVGEAEARHHAMLAPSVVVDLAPGAPGISAGRPGPATLPPAATIPVGATVFFRNLEREHFVEVSIHGDFESCAGCVSVTNFSCAKDGAVAAAVEPDGVCTLCFHKPGRYPLAVLGGGQALYGSLEVTAASPAPGGRQP
jgi:hypothetical protein